MSDIHGRQSDALEFSRINMPQDKKSREFGSYAMPIGKITEDKKHGALPKSQKYRKMVRRYF